MILYKHNNCFRGESIEINFTSVKLRWPPFSTFISDFIGPDFNMITRKYIEYIPKSCRLAKMVSHIMRNILAGHKMLILIA